MIKNKRMIDYLRRTIRNFHDFPASDLKSVLTHAEIVLTLNAGKVLICLDKESAEVIILIGGIIQRGINCSDYISTHIFGNQISNKDKLNKLL